MKEKESRIDSVHVCVCMLGEVDRTRKMVKEYETRKGRAKEGKRGSERRKSREKNRGAAVRTRTTLPGPASRRSFIEEQMFET